nr:hypothetical protein [Tanacetum cinerariifolium]
MLKLKFGRVFYQIKESKEHDSPICHTCWMLRSTINAFGNVYGENHVFEYIQGKIDFEYTCEANLSAGRVNVTGDLGHRFLYIPLMCMEALRKKSTVIIYGGGVVSLWLSSILISAINCPIASGGSFLRPLSVNSLDCEVIVVVDALGKKSTVIIYGGKVVSLWLSLILISAINCPIGNAMMNAKNISIFASAMFADSSSLLLGSSVMVSRS